jgi:glutamate-ammonia-ligase adenylyltransferase
MRFDEFLRGLPAGIQLFSMFHANPKLLALMADIMGGAPKLAQHLSGHPSALDAVLSPDFFDPLPDGTELTVELADAIAGTRDFQDVLDAARRWANDRKLQIGVQALQGLIDWTQAGGAFADVAAAAISGLQDRVAVEFARRHGRVPGGAWAIIGMGKLGGREMTPTSDLDLIIVYDHAEGAANSDGEQPLEPSRYYARLVQRLINAITAPTPEGKLYDVDMRLRPSGTSGPIASHIAGFEKYHEEQAWTWEHMALTRASVIAGDPALGRRIEAVIQRTLTAARDAETLRTDVADMRDRIAREHVPASPWDVKYIPGGLVDVEFVAQYLQLREAAENPSVLHRSTRGALSALAEQGRLVAADADILLGGLRLWQTVQGMLRLTLDRDPSADDALPEALKRALARTASEADFPRLVLHMKETAQSVRTVYDRLIGTGRKQ